MPIETGRLVGGLVHSFHGVPQMPKTVPFSNSEFEAIKALERWATTMPADSFQLAMMRAAFELIGSARVVVTQAHNWENPPDPKDQASYDPYDTED